MAIEKDINGNLLAWFSYERCKSHPKLAHEDELIRDKRNIPLYWKCRDCGRIAGLMKVN